MNISKLIYLTLLALTTVTTTICEKQPLDEKFLHDEDDEHLKRSEKLGTEEWSNYYWLTTSSLIALQTTTLLILGQPVISRTSGMKLWCGEVLSRENSQHLTDWYTFTHIIHGVIYYWITGVILPRASTPLRFLLAAIAETAWEIVENSPSVIERYRRTALANGYSGDSIVNSVSDTIAMTVGFYISNTLPAGVMTIITITTELICAYVIRDNLILNIIQLIHPFKSISRWQTNL